MEERGGGFMDVLSYISRLLDDLERVASLEERAACDRDWLCGYVAGVAAAAQCAIEARLEDESAPTE